MQKNACALTPPMGWNSWDCYGASVTEETLLKNARFMADHLRQHGWEYIVCDIQWAEPTAASCDYHPFAPLCMDAYGRLIPAPNRFPSSAGGKGFAPIAQQIHDMGLKFGIHIMRGVPRQAVHAGTPVLGTNVTARDIAHPFSLCRWNTDMYGVNPHAPGAQAYYDSLFALYAQWGVDYVKIDDICNTNTGAHDPYSGKAEIEMYRKAIDACGRPMVLSLSPGPAVVEHAWHLSQHANMWRITDDFWDRWDLLKAMFERCDVWQTHVRPGCWPDCDMLPIGRLRCFDGQGENSHFTMDEARTMMTLWCVFRSPLMMGGDLPRSSFGAIALLQNDEALHLTLHSSGARQLARTGDYAAWTTRDEEGRAYLALFNLSDAPREVCAQADSLGEHGQTLYDVWEHKSVGVAGETISALLAPHASVLYRLD